MFDKTYNIRAKQSLLSILEISIKSRDDDLKKSRTPRRIKIKLEEDLINLSINLLLLLTW